MQKGLAFCSGLGCVYQLGSCGAGAVQQLLYSRLPRAKLDLSTTAL